MYISKKKATKNTGKKVPPPVTTKTHKNLYLWGYRLTNTREARIEEDYRDSPKNNGPKKVLVVNSEKVNHPISLGI